MKKDLASLYRPLLAVAVKGAADLPAVDRKAHRLAYLNERTIRIVDRRSAWRAKQPGRHQPVVKDHSPIGAVSASNPKSNPAAPIG